MSDDAELTDDEKAELEDLAQSDDPWADAVGAYLSAIEEAEG
ncbi:hypothetical protein [Halanaeroarchaeum sp. HSR-CO]|nr:hypothetical protein [Halanaeroarchaeum sp. HSR-CO]